MRSTSENEGNTRASPEGAVPLELRAGALPSIPELRVGAHSNADKKVRRRWGDAVFEQSLLRRLPAGGIPLGHQDI